MSTREQLAEVIRDGVGVWRTPLEAADAILAAGYGNLDDAWDEGHESGFWNGRESAGNVEGLRIGAEHAYQHNPYRSES